MWSERLRKRRKEGRIMMKKIVLCLAMLLLSAAPVSAAVTLSATVDCCDVTISYVNTESEHVRAFALDIVIVSGDANIIDVCSYKDNNYTIYPGSFVAGGSPLPDNNIVADDGYNGTLEGYNTSAMTVEMGSLYVDESNAPQDTCDLLTFVVDGVCTIDVCENVIRGGIVMEDPDASSNVNLAGVQGIVTAPCPTEFDCYTGPDTADWESLGKPDSWCNPRQCHGDADGILNTYGRGGGSSAWIAIPDVQVLAAGFKTTYGGDPVAQPWISADFDHEMNTYGRGGGSSARVAIPDVQVLAAWFKTAGVPTDCLDASPVSP